VSYDRAALVRCHLHVHADPRSGFGDYDREGDAFNAALLEYQQGLLSALEQLFGATLDLRRAAGFDQRVLLMLFSSTMRSYLGARTPWSGFQEAGLLITRLEATGAVGQRVNEASRTIEEAHKASQSAHLDILDALATHVLGAQADTTFDSADLLAIGFNDSTYPRASDYPYDED